MSDLQHDIHLVDLAFGIAFDDNDPAAEAWQRIRARLTPDRERVARAIYGHAAKELERRWAAFDGADEWVRESFLAAADAAIDAMGEAP